MRRLREGGVRLWDAMTAWDPGLLRLGQGLFTALSMSGALAAIFGLAELLHLPVQQTVVSMLLGTMIAMMGVGALVGPHLGGKVRTALLFVPVTTAGMVLGILAGSHTDLVLIGFVVVMFAAVWVRRFGPAWFSCGFMGWMGYFFASFLHATWAALPLMVGAVAVGAAVVLLLSATLGYATGRRLFTRVAWSFRARGRRLARACAQLLSATPESHNRRAWRVRRARGRVAEAALMAEAWAADERMLPPGWTPLAMRRRLVDLQVSLAEIAAASLRLAHAGEHARALAGPCLRLLADGHLDEADEAADQLTDACRVVLRSADADVSGAPTTGVLLADLRTATVSTPAGRPAENPAQRDARSGLRLAAAVRDDTRLLRARGTPPPDDGDEDAGFTPAVTLTLGNLPRSGAWVKTMAVRGRPWQVLSRLRFTTRQALQVACAGALAIVFGRMLSDYRYYWAVIAAFVAFSGTGTRSETTVKSLNRVAGTMAGLVVGVLLAHVTRGHIGWILVVIVGCMSAGFYLLRVTYAGMVFFLTVAIAQLYSVLGEFSDELLVLRLEETAIGAACGILVALLVAPVGTRDAVESARSALLSALSQFLDAASRRLSGPDEPDLDGRARLLDERLRALTDLSAPIIKPFFSGNDRVLARHRLTLYAETVRAAQALARPLRVPDVVDAQLADAAGVLAGAVQEASTVPMPLGVPAPPPPGDTADALRRARDVTSTYQAPTVALAAVRAGLARVAVLMRTILDVAPAGE